MMEDTAITTDHLPMEHHLMVEIMPDLMDTTNRTALDNRATITMDKEVTVITIIIKETLEIAVLV